jgi:hypothetical protein
MADFADSQPLDSGGDGYSSMFEGYDSLDDNVEMVDGELQFSVRELEPVEEDSSYEQETEEVVEETAPEPAPEPVNWEKRYADAQRWGGSKAEEAARLRERVQYLEGRLAGTQPPQEQRQPDPGFDPYEVMSDPARFDQVINERAARMAEAAVEARLREYEPVLVQMSLTAELQDTVNRYGDEFIALQPQISKVFQHFARRGEDISFEEAFHLAREFGGTPAAPAARTGRTPQGTPAPGPSAAPSRRVNARELHSRAARVNAETGVAGAAVTESKVEARNFREAFDMAVADLTRGR